MECIPTLFNFFKIGEIMMDKKVEKEFLYSLFKNMENEKESFKVIGKDGFEWSEASNAKGALMGALACGLQLRDIEINQFIPGFNEVLARAYGGR